MPPFFLRDKEMVKGLVFNIQRFSLHDGPGIRTAVFMKGCPLRCLWCHNPEGFYGIPELEYNPTKCIGCGRCSVCPSGCHVTRDGVHLFERERCVRCFMCADVCPAGAILQAGREYTVDEVMKTVESDRAYYDNSGGGLTLSAGVLKSDSRIRERKGFQYRDRDERVRAFRSYQRYFSSRRSVPLRCKTDE